VPPPLHRRLPLDVLRFAIVFVLAAPFLITLSQLHPQRIACAVTPGDLGIEYEEVGLTSNGLKLSAWRRNGPSLAVEVLAPATVLVALTEAG
jgi:hypothetical protein